MATRSQPSNTTNRRSRATGRSFLPQSVWEERKSPIIKYYSQRDPELRLKDIAELMREEHLFVASEKQYKSQLVRWGLRRNMRVSDVAHILRLIREAESCNVTRKIFFCKKEKGREYVKNYLKKSDLAKTEEELLSKIDQNDQTPSYITFTDVGPSNDQQIGETGEPALLPPVPRSMYTHGLEITPSAADANFYTQADITDPYVLISQSHGSDGSPLAQEISVPWGGTGEFTNAHYSPNLSFPYASDGHFEVNPDIDGSWGPFKDTMQPLEQNGQDLNPRDITTLNGMMSITPYVLPGAETANPEVHRQSVAEQIKFMLGDRDEQTEKENSSTMIFLKHCFEACLYQGQQQYFSEAQQALERATETYSLILQIEREQSLIVLNNLLALFDAYGQKGLTMQIFDGALRAAESCLEPSHPITQSIYFMMSIPEQGSGAQPNYDIPFLRSIYQRLADPEAKEQHSPLALAAHFNLAWALTEMEQYDEAREILMHLRVPCENVFGPYQIQTIGCIATLARVYLCTGQERSAEFMMRETVMTRVDKRFSNSHPYFWEAKNRYALFLLKLAKVEQNARRKLTYIQEAEGILRQILLIRHRQLSTNNPRTHITFRALKRLLRKQQRGREADNLHNWCVTAENPEDPITTY